MEKKRYYLSIHTSPNTWEIRDENEAATFDFEIEATPEEVKQIEDLFTATYTSDYLSYVHAHFLNTDTVDRDHAMADGTLNELYHKVYELGTPDTKKKIEQMGILDALKGSPYKANHNMNQLGEND